MERSSASVAWESSSAVPACREGAREGRLNPQWVPIAWPSRRRSLRRRFSVVARPLVVDSSSEMVFTGPCGPANRRNRFDAPASFPFSPGEAPSGPCARLDLVAIHGTV